MRPGTYRKALLLGLIATLAPALASCGGRGGESTSPGRAEPTPRTVAAAPGGDERRGHGASRAEERHSPPAPGFEQSGTLDIPAFGVEASVRQRKAAGSVLEAYLRAREARDWALACHYLRASARSEVEELAAQLDPQNANGRCGAALETVLKFLKTDYRDLAEEGISSLRIKPGSGAGFALFHGSDGADYWAAMRVEGGAWRMLSHSPTDLRASR